MKSWHLGLLTAAGLLATAALSRAAQDDAKPREREPSAVVFSGPVTSVYWLEHGNTARGYTIAAAEGAGPQSVSVIRGIAESITGRVYESWVVIEVGREVVVVPREKVISLRFQKRQD